MFGGRASCLSAGGPTLDAVHPLERLRYVARNPVGRVQPLIEESASALASLAHDRRSLLSACRRLLERRGYCGPLVWMAARMVAAVDCHDEVIDIVNAMDCDTAAWKLNDGLVALSDDFTALKVVAVGDVAGVDVIMYITPDWACTGPEDPGRAAEVDVVLVASDCAGPREALVPVGALPVVETAQQAGTPVWLVTEAGRMLPGAMWDLLSKQFVTDDLMELGLAVLDVERFVDRVVTPSGMYTPAEAGRASDCPVVPELFA